MYIILSTSILYNYSNLLQTLYSTKHPNKMYNSQTQVTPPSPQNISCDYLSPAYKRKIIVNLKYILLNRAEIDLSNAKKVWEDMIFFH